jgi:hypothetical protein
MTNTMKNSISLSDFRFTQVAYGRYNVTYTSPVTGKEFAFTTTDMPLIDATKNNDSPKKCDLKVLKSMCKRGF